MNDNEDGQIECPDCMGQGWFRGPAYAEESDPEDDAVFASPEQVWCWPCQGEGRREILELLANS